MYHLRRSHGFWGQLQGSQPVQGLCEGTCCQLHPCWWSMPEGLGCFEFARFCWESNRGSEQRIDGSTWQHQGFFVTESCGRNGNQVLEEARFQCHWGSCQEIRAFRTSTNTEFQEGTWFLEGFPVDARVFWEPFRFGLREQIVWCIWCQPARVSYSSPCSWDSWVWTLAFHFGGLVRLVNSNRHSCGGKLWSQNKLFRAAVCSWSTLNWLILFRWTLAVDQYPFKDPRNDGHFSCGCPSRPMPTGGAHCGQMGWLWFDSDCDMFLPQNIKFNLTVAVKPFEPHCLKNATCCSCRCCATFLCAGSSRFGLNDQN